MAVQRDTPYGSFNFLVNFATRDVSSDARGIPRGQRHEHRGDLADHRNGNSETNHPIKVNGVYKVRT